MAKKKKTSKKRTSKTQPLFKSTKFLVIALAVLLGTLLTFTKMSGASAADSNEVVTGDTSTGENQPGWMFGRDQSNATPFEFNDDKASIGVGSLFVEPIGATPTQKFIAEYFYLDTVDDFNSFSYDFQIAGDGVADDAEHFYLNVYTNLPGTPVDNFYQCRYDFVPTLGSTTDFETFTVDGTTVPARVQPRNGATCPPTLGGLPSGSTIRVFAVNVGDTSANDVGLVGYLDNVVVDTTSGVTTYDFEPPTTPASKDECKNGGWQSFSTPTFKNQGQCVSYVQANEKAGKRN